MKKADIKFLIDKNGYEKLDEKLKSVPLVIIPRALDKLTTTLAAKGRKYSSQEEADKLNLGKRTNDKWYNSKGTWIRKTGGTVWNNKTQTYVSKRNGLKMANFNFESSAFSKKRIRIRHYSEISLTSQLQNLWAKPTKPYTKKSPPYYIGGTVKKNWKAGKSRPAKLSFETFKSEVAKGTDLTVSIVSKWLDDEIKGLGF